MQTFAIIPAAGRSQRMGRPKLLLPWGESTVLEHVLATWRASRVGRVVVVVHPADDEIARHCAAFGAEVVRPQVPPAEMKDSVTLALDRLAAWRPQATDAWLMAPADMPSLAVETIDDLINHYEAALQSAGLLPTIWAPRHQDRRGHPVLFPWSMAAEVSRLAPGEGINALLARHEVQYFESTRPAIDDLDTPEDYRRLRTAAPEVPFHGRPS
jgi:molybdenum cofactor cytidylyltransferase